MGRIDKYTMKYRDEIIDNINGAVKDDSIVGVLNEIRKKEQDDEYNIYSHPQSGNIVVDAKLEGLDNYSFMVDTTLITNEMYPYDYQHQDGIESGKERVYFRYKCTAPKTTVLGWSQVVNENLLQQYQKGTQQYGRYYNLLKSTGIWKLQKDPDDTGHYNNPFDDKEGQEVTITRQLDVDDPTLIYTDFDKDQAFNGAELRGVKITEGDIETAYPITYDNYEDLQIDICCVNQRTKKLEKLTQYNNFYKIIDQVADAEEYYNLNDYIQKIAGKIYLKITHNGETYWSDVKKEDVLLFCNNPFFNYNKESQSIELYFYSNNEAGVRDAVTSDNLDAQQEENLFTITTVPYSDICKYNNLKRSITLDINKVNSGLCYISNYTYTKDEDTMQIHMTLNNYAKDEGYVSHFFIEAFAPFENKSIFYDISPLVTDNHISFTLNPIITKDGEMVFTDTENGNGMLDIKFNSSAELFIENGIDRSQIASGNIGKYAFSFSNSLSVEEKRFYILRFILFDENGGRITTILDGKGRVNDVRCLYTTGMFNDNTEQDFMDCLVREKVDEYGELEIVGGVPNVEGIDTPEQIISNAYSEKKGQPISLQSNFTLHCNASVRCVVNNKNAELFDIKNLQYKKYKRFTLTNAHEDPNGDGSFKKFEYYAVPYGSENWNGWGIDFKPTYNYSLSLDQEKFLNSITYDTEEELKTHKVEDGLHKEVRLNITYNQASDTYSIDYTLIFQLVSFSVSDKPVKFTFNLRPAFFSDKDPGGGKTTDWLRDRLIDNLIDDDLFKIKDLSNVYQTNCQYDDRVFSSESTSETTRVGDMLPKYIDTKVVDSLNEIPFGFSSTFNAFMFDNDDHTDNGVKRPIWTNDNTKVVKNVSSCNLKIDNFLFKLGGDSKIEFTDKVELHRYVISDQYEERYYLHYKDRTPLFHFITYHNDTDHDIFFPCDADGCRTSNNASLWTGDDGDLCDIKDKSEVNKSEKFNKAANILLVGSIVSSVLAFGLSVILAPLGFIFRFVAKKKQKKADMPIVDRPLINYGDSKDLYKFWKKWYNVSSLLTTRSLVDQGNPNDIQVLSLCVSLVTNSNAGVKSQVDVSVRVNGVPGQSDDFFILPQPILYSEKEGVSYINFPYVYLRLLIYILKHVVIYYKDDDDAQITAYTAIPGSDIKPTYSTSLEVGPIAWNKDTVNPFSFYDQNGNTIFFLIEPDGGLSSLKQILLQQAYISILNSIGNIPASNLQCKNTSIDLWNNFNFNTNNLSILNKNILINDKQSIYLTIKGIDTAARCYDGKIYLDARTTQSESSRLARGHSYVYIDKNKPELMKRIFNVIDMLFLILPKLSSGLIDISDNFYIYATILNLNKKKKTQTVVPVLSPICVTELFKSMWFDGEDDRYKLNKDNTNTIPLKDDYRYTYKFDRQWKNGKEKHTKNDPRNLVSMARVHAPTWEQHNVIYQMDTLNGGTNYGNLKNSIFYRFNVAFDQNTQTPSFPENN